MVRKEVLAGARDELHQRDLSRLLARATLIPIRPGDFDQAAASIGSVGVVAKPFAFSSIVLSAL